MAGSPAASAYFSLGHGRAFATAFQKAGRDGSLVDAYHQLLIDSDPAIHEQAARDWWDWEMAIVAVHPNADRLGLILDSANVPIESQTFSKGWSFPVSFISATARSSWSRHSAGVDAPGKSGE